MAVPTTETASDRLLEKKKLEGDITVLKQQKETEQQEVKQWTEAKTVLLNEFGSLTHLDHVTEHIGDTLRQSREKKKATLQEDIDALEARKQTLQQSTQGLQEHTQTLQDNTARAETSLATLRATIAKETLEWNKDKETIRCDQDALREQLRTLREESQVAMAERDIALVSTSHMRRDALAEELRLSTKAKDLAIWEARIRKWYAELYPNKDFNL